MFRFEESLEKITKVISVMILESLLSVVKKRSAIFIKPNFVLLKLENKFKQSNPQIITIIEIVQRLQTISFFNFNWPDQANVRTN